MTITILRPCHLGWVTYGRCVDGRSFALECRRQHEDLSSTRPQRSTVHPGSGVAHAACAALRKAAFQTAQARGGAPCHLCETAGVSASPSAELRILAARVSS